MKKFLISISLLVFGLTALVGQNLDYVKTLTAKLCSPELFGRAYVNKGDSLAADYIASEFSKWKLKSFGKTYIQPFEMSINSQPKADIWLDGQKMPADGNLVVEASSPSQFGTFPVIQVNAPALKYPRSFIQSALNHPGGYYLLDSVGLNNPELYNFAKTLIYSPIIPNAGIIEVMHRAPFGIVRKHFDPYVKIQLHHDLLPDELNEISVSLENRYNESYISQNVIGYIEGKSDDWLVFTGHYDGEGMYGDVLFPAGNDNASGTAMVMDLARHYAKNRRPHYNMAFMLVSGEEAGLLGSRHYASHPLFPMEKIRMVINLDMVATGERGVMLFNGETWPIERDKILEINTKNQYMSTVSPTGPAANSDHHAFHEKGVPAIFFLTHGKAGPAHTAFDYADSLLWPKYDQLFSLITDFIDELPDLPEPIRYPLVDYHVHLKGDMTLEKAVEKSEKSGIQYGIAVNCGVGFPVNSDEGALVFLDSMRNTPFMLAMQAEGREWVETFSPEVIDQFDYVFTDAMTYFNDQGERVRLWMPDEVSIPDTQAFMDDLVRRIVKIVSEEPIDIYVNPTFLPDVIATHYDELWTRERMDAVITALVDSGVALEINNRYRIPSESFIKRAKEAGVRFAFGTNNTDSQTRDLDYCREMISKCRLLAIDMWKPGQ